MALSNYIINNHYNTTALSNLVLQDSDVVLATVEDDEKVSFTEEDINQLQEIAQLVDADMKSITND